MRRRSQTWQKSILIPIFKNKGDIVKCGNYRGIKQMCHSMKLYERVHENRLRNIVSISEEQFRFGKVQSTTDAIFALRQLQERYREGQQEEETLFDPKSTNVQITIPHISDIQFKQLCTHIYRHYVHKHSS